MRGEHTGRSDLETYTLGSSPHARGAPAHRDGQLDRVGIIPACAGSTTSAVSMIGRSGDHPRMRGEHLAFSSQSCGITGSSPHARGALLPFQLDGTSDGIIPACAGSTSRRALGSRRAWDHPRMRGEHDSFLGMLTA